MKALVGVAVVAAGLAGGAVRANQPVDDGPCPAGTYAWLPDGADYEGGYWLFANGVAFGYAPFEDECWSPVAPWVVERPAQAEGVIAGVLPSTL